MRPFVALAALPAIACPTDADLDRGVTIRFGEASTSIYTRLPDGLIQEDVYEIDGYAYRVVSDGVLERYYAELSDGAPTPDTEETVSTDFTMPPLDPGAAAFGTETRTSDLYGAEREPMRLRVGARGRLPIGACLYQGVWVTTQTGPSGAHSTLRFFVPDALPIAILLGYGYSFEAEDTYTAHEITVGSEVPSWP